MVQPQSDECKRIKMQIFSFDYNLQPTMDCWSCNEIDHKDPSLRPYLNKTEINTETVFGVRASLATGTTLGSGSRRNEIISFSSFCFRTNLFRAVFVHFRNLAAVPEKWPQPEIYCAAPPPSVSKAENNWVKIFARLLMTLIRVSFDPLVVWLMIQLTTNRMDTSVTHHTFLHGANSWDLFGWPS